MSNVKKLQTTTKVPEDYLIVVNIRQQLEYFRLIYGEELLILLIDNLTQMKNKKGA